MHTANKRHLGRKS